MKRTTKRYTRKNAKRSKLQKTIGTIIFVAAVCMTLFSEYQEMKAAEEAVRAGQSAGMSGYDADGAFSGMEVHYIDVGQSDATLITCGGEAMLIDAGDDSKGTAVQNYLQKRGITELKYLILTHPDSDHIGGAPVVISKFDIDKVYMSDFRKNNKLYGKLLKALDDKRLKWSTPKPGATGSLGDAVFTILAPNRSYSDPNNASVALLIEHGENSFIFTGDAEEEAEADMLENGLPMEADVYQAGHHGSRTASSEPFMDEVAPKTVVISCGVGNRYGHPHAQALNTYRARGIDVYRTDEQGSIVAVSDGKKITWNCAPSDTWKSGEPGR